MLVCFDEIQGYTWPEISILELLHGRCDAKEAGGGESGGRPTSREERARFGAAEFVVGRDPPVDSNGQGGHHPEGRGPGDTCAPGKDLASHVGFVAKIFRVGNFPHAVRAHSDGRVATPPGA
jgi:hypothetical protein